MDEINYNIACDVTTCKHNFRSSNCMLKSIKVGCTCDAEKCTCCQSYSEKI